MTNLKFTSVCRWAFPHVQGGIPMYNYHLLNTLYKKFDFKIVSHQNSTNMNFYANMGIQFVGYNNFHNDLYNQLTRLKILNNILRSWSDWNNSFKIMRTIDNNISGLIEFMDIHSEGYLYLKKFPKENRKARVIIRSHTPWALLRKYYPKDIIKYVDSWWAVEREKYCFHNCDAITVPSNDLKKQLVNTFDITGDKIKVLPNLVDTDHFKPIDRYKVKQIYIEADKNPRDVRFSFEELIIKLEYYYKVVSINHIDPEYPLIHCTGYKI